MLRQMPEVSKLRDHSKARYNIPAPTAYQALSLVRYHLEHVVIMALEGKSNAGYGDKAGRRHAHARCAMAQGLRRLQNLAVPFRACDMQCCVLKGLLEVRMGS